MRNRTRLLSLFLCLLLAATAAAQRTLVVNRPVANMYSGPTEDTDVVSQALFGAPVTVVEDKGDWLKIRTADDYMGWAQKTALIDKPYAASGAVATVRALVANLYREKSVTKHAPMLAVPFDSRLEIADPGKEGDRWLQVRLPDGRTAFVQNGDVTLQTVKLDIPGSISHAKRFLGVNYLWAGTSTFGFDCSGFTQMLMKQRGILMPRDADVQAAWNGLVAVDKKDLQPGDLLYFGSSPQKITHTGYYIGDGKFIHATTHEHPEVQISDINEAYWTKLLVACRRAK